MLIVKFIAMPTEIVAIVAAILPHVISAKK